jgi:acetate kinase
VVVVRVRAVGLALFVGVRMAIRSGSLEPSLIFHDQKDQGLRVADVRETLNPEPGLFGVSGV